VRTFLALDIDDKDVLRRIKDVQQRIIKTEADLKLVEEENLHFTVKFLGEISELQAEKVIRAIEKVQVNPVRVICKGLGVFPSPIRISVIWVGVDKSCYNELFAIANFVEERLKGLFPRDKRGFQPHLTISRVKGGRNKDKLLAVVKEYEDFVFGEQIIEHMKMKKSDLTPKGPIYTDIYTFPFKKHLSRYP